MEPIRQPNTGVLDGGHVSPGYVVQGGLPGQRFCMRCGFYWSGTACQMTIRQRLWNLKKNIATESTFGIDEVEELLDILLADEEEHSRMFS